MPLLFSISNSNSWEMVRFYWLTTLLSMFLAERHSDESTSVMAADLQVFPDRQRATWTSWNLDSKQSRKYFELWKARGTKQLQNMLNLVLQVVFNLFL